MHIAVDEFYLIHLRRAFVFAQRELPTSFFSENQTIVKGLSWILEKNKKILTTFLWSQVNFFVKETIFLAPVIELRAGK